MKGCVFCRIIDGNISSRKVFENDEFLVIHDIQPQAKTHLLVLPKRHISSLVEGFPESGVQETELMGKLLQTGVRVARQEGLLPQGFRSVINTGEQSGQTVFHVHLHVLGGEPLRAGFA